MGKCNLGSFLRLFSILVLNSFNRLVKLNATPAKTVLATASATRDMRHVCAAKGRKVAAPRMGLGPVSPLR
jgi:hypothetical protein